MPTHLLPSIFGEIYHFKVKKLFCHLQLNTHVLMSDYAQITLNLRVTQFAKFANFFVEKKTTK